MYEGILGFADQHFDDARAQLRTWLQDHELAEDLGELVENLSSWRSHSRLAKVAFKMRDHYLVDVDIGSLWGRWKNERLTDPVTRRRRISPEDLFGSFDELRAWFERQCVTDEAQVMSLYLEWWRRKDLHLTNYARDIQLKLGRMRKDYYRTIAAYLAARYERLYLGHWDMSETAKKPAPEKDTRNKRDEKASGVRQIVGISILKEALKHAFGERLVEVESAFISQTHYSCGGQLIGLANVDVQCTDCGNGVDQDVNAARHLWERGERSGGDKNPGTARMTESLGNAAE